MERTFENPRETAKFALKPALNEGLRRNREVNLVSNYLKISFRPNNNFVRQYFMRFEPEIAGDNEILKRQIIRGVGRQLREVFHPCITSGDSLFSAQIVNERIEINYTNRDNEDQEYRITIEKTGNEIDLSNIKSINNFSNKVKTFIEIVIKNILNANQGMIRFNKRNIFDYNAGVQLKDSGKAFLLPGYSTSVIITESGIYLRAGVKNKFINGKTCWEKIEELQKTYKNGEFCRAVTEFFKNQSVMTTYGNYRVYKIDTVSFDLTVTNKTIMTRDRDGVMTEITLQRYYEIQYSKQIKILDQPLLVSYKKTSTGENDAIYLIPELCYLTGMDEEMRLNEPLKKNMTRGTKITPKERMDKIFQIKQLIYKKNAKKTVKVNRVTREEFELPDPTEIAAQWGLNVTDFKEFKGRQLDTPSLLFSGESVNISNGKFRSKKMLKPVHLDENSWAVICSQKNASDADKMTRSLNTASEQMGLIVKPPRIFKINARNKDEWVENIESLNLAESPLKIVLVVLDNYSKDYYSSIKRYLYCELGLPSQVVLKENGGKNLSYFSNVLNQMVAKMGGALYSIHLDDIFAKNPTMIIGYDSIKLGKNQRKYVMTASYDTNFSKFFTEEIIVEDSLVGPVSSLLRKCLDYFLSLYKTMLPTYIFIYRSGVSEKEKELIFNIEVKSINNLLSGILENECYKLNYTPKLCFIVVNKRTEAKFFEYSNGNVNNPKDGTVIDTQVTSPDAYEFYLQPQFVNQGTATPTHFHCIYDNSGIPLEILENITYKMCYYYWNWPGAIRVPAALKFAEVANKFSSTYVKSYVKEGLKNCPYYI